MKDRSEALDIGRGFASSYVVYHHVLIGLVGSGILSDPSLLRFDTTAGIWRMPFFFLMAGVFLPRIRIPGRDPGRFLRERASTVLWPFLLWMTVQNLLILLLPHLVNYPMKLEHLLQSVVYPPAQFWFLQFLFVSSLVLAAIEWKAPRLVPLVAIAGIVATVVFIESRQSFAYRSGMALGWGGLGVLLGRERLQGAIARAPAPLVSGIALFLLGWWASRLWPGFLLVCVVGGGIIAFGLGRSLEGTRAGALVAQIGQNSLKVYLLHLFTCAGTRIVLDRGLGIREPVIHVILGMLAGTAGLVLLSRWLEARGISWPFRFPSRRESR